MARFFWKWLDLENFGQLTGCRFAGVFETAFHLFSVPYSK